MPQLSAWQSWITQPQFLHIWRRHNVPASVPQKVPAFVPGVLGVELPCPAGREPLRLNGFATCQKCQIGKFSEGGKCAVCPVGKFASSQGLKNCSAFTHSPTAEPTGIPTTSPTPINVKCAAGKWPTMKNGTAWVVCDHCPAGKYKKVAAELSCRWCPKNKYQPGNGSTFCADCPSGKFQPEPLRTYCADLVSYYFALGETVPPTPSPTPAATAATSEPTSYPTAMPTHRPTAPPTDRPTAHPSLSPTHRPTARPSPSPTESPTPKSWNLPSGCTAGKFWIGDDSHHLCKECPSGKFQSQDNLYSCRNCPMPKFQPNHGSLRCLSYHPATPAPTQSPTRHRAPTAAPTPSYMAKPSSCPLGKYGKKMTGTESSSVVIECYACPIGKHQNRANAFGCKLCEVGKFQPLAGHSECQLKKGFNWTQAKLEMSTKPNRMGDWAPANEEDRQQASVDGVESQVDAGTPDTGLASDDDAHAPGQTGESDDDAHLITNAPTPRSTGLPGSCPPGKYSTDAAADGLLGCYKCRIGQYQDQFGKPSCITCPVGRMQSKEAGTRCENTATVYQPRYQRKP